MHEEWYIDDTSQAHVEEPNTDVYCFCDQLLVLEVAIAHQLSFS